MWHHECGQHVTAGFHRIFADNGGILSGYPSCLSATAIKNEKATGH
ncbi:DUF7563 family protein [Halalkalicoccus subterraneus]